MIREARADDLPLLRELFQDYAASLDFDLSFQNFNKELESLDTMYFAPLGACFLASANARVDAGATADGCVALRTFAPGICEMKRLYVRSSAQGQGLGKQLVLALINKAREMGFERMRLDTISTMQSAQLLYRSLGFEEIAPYRENPIEGAIYFELRLS